MRDLKRLMTESVMQILRKKIKIFALNIFQISILYVVIYKAFTYFMPELDASNLPNYLENSSHNSLAPLVIAIIINILFHSILNISLIYLTVFQLDPGQRFVPRTFILKYLPRVLAANLLIIILFTISALFILSVLGQVLGTLCVFTIFVITCVSQLFTDIIIVLEHDHAIHAMIKSAQLAKEYFMKLLMISALYGAFIFLATAIISIPIAAFMFAIIQEPLSIIVGCLLALPFKVFIYLFYLKHAKYSRTFII